MTDMEELKRSIKNATMQFEPNSLPTLVRVWMTPLEYSVTQW